MPGIQTQALRSIWRPEPIASVSGGVGTGSKRRVVKAHRPGDQTSYQLRRLNKVCIVEVRVACRGSVPPKAKQPADQRQTFTRHDGLTGGGMSQVVQPEVAELRVRAHRPPAFGKARRSPLFGIFRKQVPFGSRSPGSASMCARAASPSGTARGPVLESRRFDGVFANIAPAEIEHFASAASGERQQPDRINRLGPLGLAGFERATGPRQFTRVEEPGDAAPRILPDAETGVGVAFAQSPLLGPEQHRAQYLQGAIDRNGWPSPGSASPLPHGSSPRLITSLDGRRSCARKASPS